MKTTTSFVPLSEVIDDAAMPLQDIGFQRLGRPFYVAAAFRGLRALCFETNFNKRTWTKEVPDNLILDLPPGYIEADGAWLYNGDECNVQKSTVLYIKDNMHRLGGAGFIANNKWRNHDPLQYSYRDGGWRNGSDAWSEEPPHHLHFAGTFNGQLMLSQSCSQYRYVHMLYTASVGDDCTDDFNVPEWASEALTDYVTMRAAEYLEREDPQFLGRLIERKREEMKAPNGTWRNALWYYKRLDKKGRYDLAAKIFRFGHFAG